MKSMPSAEIRARYLRFFEARGHTIVPSSSLIPGNDPTLLFANSGMVQFKDTFLGLEQRPYSRAVTAQKCMRVSGKHNDLEEVGPSPRHQTFFEMLGNFSFGDYFKREAITMAWDLLTKEFALPVERLWFTVFAGNDRIPPDTEAERYWIEAGADPSRVLRFGEKDNFWIMGDTGPCGPCSEITVYLGDDLGKMSAAGVNSDDPDYVEIWNNVFMQFDRASMQPLPRPSVDTGMGLERMSTVLQGVKSNYDTDVFLPIIERTIALLGSDEAHYRAHFAPYRAVADHSRAVAFLIADGVLPGNTGRSYVLRRILRRAAYQGRTVGFEKPFLADVIATVIDQMGAAYPELRQRREFILETTDAEERQFLRTLAGGIHRLGAVIGQVRASGSGVIPGEEAFTLKDTYGFPLDLTQRIAAEQGLAVDEPAYERAMTEQRARSRAATQFKRGAEAEVWADADVPPTEFTGYEHFAGAARVLALVAGGDSISAASAGQAVQLVLDRTPFYAESGGQVGDSGALIGPNGRVRVSDTQRPIPGVIVHYGTVEDGTIALHDTVEVRVDAERRRSIMRNHTATHLLHRALRDVLGGHAAQAGSLVAPERLRFDFTHNRQVTPEQQREIERRINAWVRADTPVEWEVTDYQRAIDRGAMALFGEKYGDRVRMVTVGCLDGEILEDSTIPDPRSSGLMCSRELCGGTHVARTGEIGFFRIVAESSVAGGVRRIEALTGAGAEQWADAQAATLRDLAARLGVPPAQALDKLDALLNDLRQQGHDLDKLRAQSARGALEGLLGQVQRHDGVPFVAARVEAPDPARLREQGDWLRDKIGSGVVVLGALIGEKPQILAVVTPDLVKRGLHAGNIVKALAQIMGGGGGGRPDMAQAGGRDAAKLDEALAQVARLVAEQGAKS
ncbi:alanine--tRNA ligase [Kouleothrix sp.]|uniref:alanine--tRNA ligase n=1 Tax=Kouleothrix sp. TaxID=2779161 RepID=UPI00391A6945